MTLPPQRKNLLSQVLARDNPFRPAERESAERIPARDNP